MIDVVFLTALSRVQNLAILAQNISENKNENINFFWVICGDVNKIDSQKESVILETLKNTDIFYKWYISGKKGQENYGGTMFNAPLKEFYEEFLEEKDPWVYILDDDNLINKRLIESIIDTEEYFGASTIIKLNGSDDNGNVDNKPRDFSSFDPSYIVMRYSTIAKYGFFPEGVGYDCIFFPKVLSTEEPYVTTETTQNYSATHNAIADDYYFDEIENFLKQENAMAFLRLQSSSRKRELIHSSQGHFISTALSFHVFNQETIKKIIELIKEDYNKNKTL